MTADEQEIRAAVAKWMEATKARDVATVLSLMTDDVVFLTTGRPEMYRADFESTLRAMCAQDGPKIDGTSEIQEIQIHGDWAFLRSKVTVTVTPKPDAPPIVRSGPTLTIFTKKSGRWLLARDANLTTTSSQ